MGSWFSRIRSKPKQKTSPIPSVNTTPSKSDDGLFFRSNILTMFAFEGKCSPDDTGKELQNERGRFFIVLLMLQKIKAKFLKACGVIRKFPSNFISRSKNPRIQSHPHDLTLPTSSSPHDPSFEDEHRIEIFEVHESDQEDDSVMVSKTKSVRFEVVEEDEAKDVSGPISVHIHTPEKKTQKISYADYSPGPTPMKLTAEMETPGTVYPLKPDLTELRSQFVHPWSKSADSLTGQSLESNVNGPEPEEVEAQLDDKRQDVGKLWDGKGIPNSSRKYNEDQAVRWHSTPFEERIEKALSGALVLPLRYDPEAHRWH